MKKLRQNAGETLVETLTALLIATLVLLFLATAIAAASRINASVRDTDTAFRYDAATETEDTAQSLLIERDGAAAVSVPVIDHATQNGYHYYTAVGGGGDGDAS